MNQALRSRHYLDGYAIGYAGTVASCPWSTLSARALQRRQEWLEGFEAGSAQLRKEQIPKPKKQYVPRPVKIFRVPSAPYDGRRHIDVRLAQINAGIG